MPLGQMITISIERRIHKRGLAGNQISFDLLKDRSYGCKIQTKVASVDSDYFEAGRLCPSKWHILFMSDTNLSGL